LIQLTLELSASLPRHAWNYETQEFRAKGAEGMRKYVSYACLLVCFGVGCSANVTGRSSPSAPPSAVDLSKGGMGGGNPEAEKSDKDGSDKDKKEEKK
jgi:hypothetical protein